MASDHDDHDDHEARDQQVHAARDAFVAGRDQFNIHLPEPSGTVTATVAVFQENPPRGGWPMNGAVRYEGRLVDGRLLIGPRHPYLDDVKSGAELTPASDIRDRLRSSSPAKLDIKMVNNSAETVVTHHVRLEVARSVNRVHVVPFVHAASADLTPWLSIDGPIGFEPKEQNGITGVTLSFHLEDPSQPEVLTSRYEWSEYSEYGSGQAGDRHPLVLALAEAGARPVVDERLARQNYWRKYGADVGGRYHGPEFHSSLWENGPFSRARAMMVGEVFFMGADNDYVERRYSNRFRALVYLSVVYPSPPPSAMMMPPSAEYYAADRLRPAGHHYTVDIPVSHSLVPREADRLLVAFPVRSASTHDFRVSLLTTAGEVDCGMVRLETFCSDRY